MRSPEEMIERLFTEDLEKLLDKYQANFCIVEGSTYFPTTRLQVEIQSQEGYLSFDINCEKSS